MSPLGSLDPSFGSEGRVTTILGASTQASALALQPDGKLVAAGSAIRGDARDFLLARYHADGTSDTAFGNSGIVTTDFGHDDVAVAVAIQDDGRLVVAGTTSWAGPKEPLTVKDTRGGRRSQLALARYRLDGSLDHAFGVNGKVVSDHQELFNTRALVVEPGGRLVIAGFFDALGEAGTDWEESALVRYNPDGTLDTSFGEQGTARSVLVLGGGAVGASAMALALRQDGMILLAGRTTVFGASSRFGRISARHLMLALYTAQGQWDDWFGNRGSLMTVFVDRWSEGRAVLILPNGRIAVAGVAYVADSGVRDFALARYEENGNLDGSFGYGGTLLTSFDGQKSEANALGVQPDGKLVAAGVVTDAETGAQSLALARYNDDGSLDTSFGGGGKLVTSFGGSAVGHALVIQPDGKVVVSGTIATPEGTGFALARYLAN